MRLLVIDLLNIGDLLFATPSLHSLRRAFPEATIDMLVKAEFQDVVRHNPNLDNVFGVDRRGAHRTATGMLRLITNVRRRGYDVVLDVHGCARSTLLTLTSGARGKWGLASKGVGGLYNRPVTQRKDIHRVDSYLQILRDLGVSVSENLGLQMMIDDAAEERIEAIWTECRLTSRKPVFGLNPGASVLLKRWPPEKWAQLADRLNEDEGAIVLFGGPQDTSIVEEIVLGMRSAPIVLTGRLNLLELAAAVRRCSVVVSTDTGPLHIAVSQQTPVVALFGPTNPANFGPYTGRSVVCRSNVSCPECQREQGTAHTCMSAISIDQVEDGVRKLLAESVTDPAVPSPQNPHDRQM